MLAMLTRTMLGAGSIWLVLQVGAQTQPSRNALQVLSDSIREVTARIAPAVVQVVVSRYGASEGGQSRTPLARPMSSGSGVIVDSSGYVITNHHVVEGALTVQIALSPKGGDGAKADSDQLYAAHLVGADRDSDMALLKIDASGLPPIRFGDSDSVRQGDIALAIGSPLGLRNSVSMGVISSPARAVSDDNPAIYIQTDASINPGNSGGALVDTRGELIGLNTFIVSQSGGNEGIGFAIPSNVVRNVYQQLRRKGHVSRGTIGVTVQDLSPILAEGLKLPVNRGVLVADIDPDGPASRTDLKRRDVILSVNGRQIETARDFGSDIFRRQKGDKLAIVVQRGSKRVTCNPEVAEQAEPWDPLAVLASPQDNLVPRLGILCVELDAKVVQVLGPLRREYGLLVAARAPQGQAQFVDIEPGDIIHSVNDNPVSSLEYFRSAVAAFQSGDAVVLQIERDGRLRYLAFRIE